ncbi:C-C motif chemokine 19a.2 [Clarias gariepinus]|uniref:C-C motif chemokine 19a.2 n=1 Tax=Clarias gariepinus TaxID=13013 RepID=UPI00234D0323|nr:C-C motif chemokine 19a.2 [Clarias gariepinus]
MFNAGRCINIARRCYLCTHTHLQEDPAHFPLVLRKLQNSDANMTNAVVALLVFTALLWTNAQAFSNNDPDCCLSTSNAYIPRRIVESYKIQTVESGCRIAASVFITKKNKMLCAPPPSDLTYPWVLKLIEYLDARSAKGKGTK